MIKIRVDMDVCQHYGQCVFVAPEVFDMDDDGKLVYQESAADSERERVAAAVQACPVQAITIVD